MWQDPIVAEVRKARQDHAKKFGYDLKAIYNDLKSTEQLGGRRVISLTSKQVPQKTSHASKERERNKLDK